MVFVSSAEPAQFIRDISQRKSNPSDQFELVAHWTFDGKNFLADSSGHGHTLVNDGATQVDGTAMFDGKAMMSTVDSIDLTPYRKVRVSWSQKVLDASISQVVWENTENYNEHEGAICCGIADPLFDGGNATACLRTRNGYNYNVKAYDVVGGVWENIAIEYRLAGDAKNRPLVRTEVVKVFKNGMPTGSGTQREDSNLPRILHQRPFPYRGENGKRRSKRMASAAKSTI